MLNLFSKLKTVKSKIDLTYSSIYIFLATFFGLFIEGFYPESPRTTALWIIAKIIGFTLCYFAWFLISALAIRASKPLIELWKLMLIGAFGGLVQAGALESTLSLFQLENSVTLLARTSGTCVFAAIWLPIQCITVDNFKRYKKNLDEVNFELEQLDAINVARKRLVQLETSIIEKKILNMVADTKFALNNVFEGSVALSQNSYLPEIARSFSTNQLKNLVKNISELNETSSKNPSILKDFISVISFFSSALIFSIRSKPLNPFWFVGTVLPTIALPLSRLSDHLRGLSIFITVAISMITIHSVSFFIQTRLNKLQVFSAVLTTTMSCFVPIVLISQIPGAAFSNMKSIAFALCICTITIFGYIAQAGSIKKVTLLTSQKEALSKIKLQSSSLNREIARVTKMWAQHIHGTLQARLQASVLILEIAQKNDDSTAIARSIDSIREVISDLGNQVERENGSCLSSEVLTRSQLWAGIVEITVSLDPELEVLNDPCVSDISECVGEAITNSVRHGSATKIGINIVQVGPNILVVVTDNGTGLKTNRVGYGSKVFDSATIKRWTLTADPVSKVTRLNLIFSPSKAATEWLER